MALEPVVLGPGVGVVLDTNIVLDLFVFDDPAVAPLRAAIEARSMQWLATAAMREELARVLAYPQIVRSLTNRALEAQHVLARFDMLAELLPDAPKATVTCKDPDDQRFIDLAVAHGARLLSKDNAVLCMVRRLERLGVAAGRACHVSS